ncbi:MAG: DUF4358 domain-containing protein [Massilistercora timonensis]
MRKRRGFDIIDFAKYGMIVIIIAYVVFLLMREGGDAPLETVEKNVLEAVSTEGMEKAGTQDIKRYYGLNPEDYRGIALYLPDDVMGVNEVLIVRLADESQEEPVTEAAQKRLDTQKESFEGYGVEQTKLLNDAVLESKGDYVILIVSGKAQAGDEAFKKSL